MNKNKYLFGVIAIATIIIVLNSCFSDWSGNGEGYVAISLGSSGRSADTTEDAYPPSDDLKQKLTHHIEFKSGDTLIKEIDLAGGVLSATIKLPNGNYNVYITAYLDGEEYANGESSAEVNGGTTPVIVAMNSITCITINFLNAYKNWDNGEALPEDAFNELAHTIRLSTKESPNSPIERNYEKGKTSVRIPVKPDNYSISVTATCYNVEVAWGSERDVEVQERQSTSVPIEMQSNRTFYVISSPEDWEETLSYDHEGGAVILITKDITVTKNATISNFYIDVIICGDKTITFNGKGILLTVNFLTSSNASVVLYDTKLEGNKDNNNPLVYVGSNFIMKGSASIFNNTNNYDSLAGSELGGGVFVVGNFTMQDYASVHDNETTKSGGGVYVSAGAGTGASSTDITFTMQGNASVYKNTVTSLSGNAFGGGVYVQDTVTFIMKDNTSVYGNYAYNLGGGVYVFSNDYKNGIFKMFDNASISGNKSTTGGGVAIDNSTDGKSSFYFVGGIIYGSDETSDKKNTASTTSYSAALFVSTIAKAERGTFDGDKWICAEGGTLTTTDKTISVKNGVLQK